METQIIITEIKILEKCHGMGVDIMNIILGHGSYLRDIAVRVISGELSLSGAIKEVIEL